MPLHLHNPVQAHPGADLHRKLQQEMPDHIQTTGYVFRILGSYLLYKMSVFPRLKAQIWRLKVKSTKFQTLSSIDLKINYWFQALNETVQKCYKPVQKVIFSIFRQFWGCNRFEPL